MEPLNLPRGSVRSILALLIVLAAIAMVFFPVANGDAATALLVLASVVARDYFAYRKDQNAIDGPPVGKSVIG